ncbi:MAG: hypothetical protein M1272_06445, partial [Firmicutes bacterium]|nr:hypothetical protein [Bacillota bacterium]
MANARGIPAQSVVENDYWRMAVVPDWGGQMTSLVYRPANEELLRVPPSHEAWLAQPYLYGIPILFPPGRIRGGEFRWRNETYHWPKTDTAGPNHLHGFVANQPWDVVDWTPHSMALETDAAADETMARYFGARVHLTVRYVLEGPWAGIPR